jgi:hypothetical protein
MPAFNDVSQEQIDNLVTQLRAQQTTVTQSGNEYTIAGHGVQSTAVYDPQAKTLAVTVTHKPFYVTEAMIENGIANALKS